MQRNILQPAKKRKIEEDSLLLMDANTDFANAFYKEGNTFKTFVTHHVF